jgi:hypothetical protein
VDSDMAMAHMSVFLFLFLSPDPDHSPLQPNPDTPTLPGLPLRWRTSSSPQRWLSRQSAEEQAACRSRGLALLLLGREAAPLIPKTRAARHRRHPREREEGGRATPGRTMCPPTGRHERRGGSRREGLRLRATGRHKEPRGRS